MATRGTIALEYPNGSIRLIYSHWDNYLEGTGKTLFEHYNTFEKIEKVILLGDVSSLREEIGEKHSFEWTSNKSQYSKEELAKFERWSLFYGRDRDEPKTNYRWYSSFSDYQTNASFEEFNYIFKDGEWLVSRNGQYFDRLEMLLEELIS